MQPIIVMRKLLALTTGEGQNSGHDVATKSPTGDPLLDTSGVRAADPIALSLLLESLQKPGESVTGPRRCCRGRNSSETLANLNRPRA